MLETLKQNKRRLLHYIIFFVVALALSLEYVELRFTMCRQHDKATIASVASDKAYTPFQFRVLIPKLTKFFYERNYETPISYFNKTWLVGVLDPYPERMEGDYDNYINKHAWSTIQTWMSQKTISDYRGFITIYRRIEIAAVLGFLIAFRVYMGLFIKNEAACSILSLFSFFALAFTYLMTDLYYPGLLFPADTASILFFTVGLILIYKEKWIPYYLLFAVATVNRETSCFLTVTYLFTAWGTKGRWRIMGHVAAQAVIWLAIKFQLSYYYSTNLADEHGIFGMRLWLNLKFLIYQNWNGFNDQAVVVYPHLMRTMGYLWIPLLFYYKRIRPTFVRRSVLVIIPFGLGMLMVGSFPELRIWGEMTPIVVSGFALILYDLISEWRPAGGEEVSI